MEENLFTLIETAAILKVTYRTVLRYIKTGELKARRMGGRWRVLRSDLDDFLREKPETVEITSSDGKTTIIEIEKEE